MKFHFKSKLNRKIYISFFNFLIILSVFLLIKTLGIGEIPGWCYYLLPIFIYPWEYGKKNGLLLTAFLIMIILSDHIINYNSGPEYILLNLYGIFSIALLIYLNLTLNNSKRKTEKLYQLFESVSTAIISLDKNLIITAWNLGAENLYGIKAKNAMGRFFEEVVQSDGEEKVSSFFIRKLKDEDSFVYNSVHHTVDNSPIEVECSVITLRNDLNLIKGYFCNIRPVNKEINKEFIFESEDKLKFIADYSSDLYSVTDEKGSIIYFNITFKKILGYDSNSLKHSSLFSIINTNDIEENIDWKEIPKQELRLKKHNGDLIWMEVFSHKIKWYGKDAVLIVAHNSADQKLIQEAYIRSEKRFRLAVDNFPNAFIIYDSQRRYQYINSFGMSLLGKNIENYFGKKDEEIFPSEVTDQYLPHLLKCYETKKHQIIERKLNFNNKEYSLILIYVPYLNSKNEVEQVFSYSYDVSGRKKAEELLISEKDKTEKMIEIFNEISEMSLNYELILNSIANKIVDLIGDGCLIFIKSNDNRFYNPVVFRMNSRDGENHLKDLFLKIKINNNKRSFAGIFVTKKPLILKKITTESLRGINNNDFQNIILENKIPSFIILPLIYHDEVIGILTLFKTKNGAVYSNDDISFVSAVAHRAALAIGNSRIYLQRMKEIEERKKIEFQLKSQKKRSEILAQLSKQFTEAGLDYNKVIDLIVKRVGEIVGEGCIIYILSNDDQYLHPSAIYHKDKNFVSEFLENFQKYPQKSDEGLQGLSVRSGEPIFIPYVEKEKFELLVKKEHIELVNNLNIKSYITVPLKAQGITIGTMCLFRTNEIYYSFEEFDFALAIADLAALAISNSRLYNEKLYEIEVRRHTEDKLNEQNFRFELINDLSKKFSESPLIVQAILDAAVEKISQAFNTLTIIHVINDDGNIKFGASHHSNSKINHKLSKYKSCNICRSGPLFVTSVIESGTLIIEDDFDHKDILSQNCSMLEFIEDDIDQIISIPLKSFDKLIGVLTITNNSRINERKFRNDEEGIAFLNDIASRISSAITNAQLHLDLSSEIEERAFIEEALMHQQDLLKKVIETIPVAVLVVNKEEEIILSNEAVNNLWEGKNYSDKSFLEGYKAYAIGSIKELEYEDWPIIKAINKGEVSVNEVMDITCFSGNRKTILNSAAPIYNRDNKIIGGVSVSQDITELKKIERDLTITLAELQRSNVELEQFAYVASHDLQEPVRMVNNFSKLMLKRHGSSLENEAKEFLDYITDGATRMQMLISDLLKYSRVGSNQREFVETNINDIIKSILVDMQLTIEENSAIINYTNLPKVNADPIQIRQLFQNLISNAIKFKDGRAPIINITCHKNKSEYLFNIEDNGIGIDAEFYQKVFVIFQRLHNRENYPGTGIGLTVCKKIVERHGGTIWVESTPGVGSTFKFTLPA